LKKALSVPLLAALLNCLLEEHQDPRNYTWVNCKEHIVDQ
jgi:hypothetical protein